MHCLRGGGSPRIDRRWPVPTRGNRKRALVLHRADSSLPRPGPLSADRVGFEPFGHEGRVVDKDEAFRIKPDSRAGRRQLPPEPTCRMHAHRERFRAPTAC